MFNLGVSFKLLCELKRPIELLKSLNKNSGVINLSITSSYRLSKYILSIKENIDSFF